ncbi:MAG: hypothetical protein IJ306_03595 [Oscillospiraceae bacterium]|nr:hypothetical protein [Oscillospiraceae bacterium]
MIDFKENELINNRLDTLYKKYDLEFIEEWQKVFKDEPPKRLNAFGIINIHKYDMDNGILFICRETNNWKNEDYSKGVLFRSWMCEMTENGLSDHAKRHPNMWYNIGRWAMLINSPETPIEEIASLKSEVISCIGNIAFTNINKVRGKEQAETEYNLLAKTPVAGEVLKREIEIIKPKIIVCCGTGWVFDRNIKNYDGKVIYMPHPGARANTENMLMKLKKQL